MDAGIRYKNFNAKRLGASNQRLLWCNADGTAKAEQEIWFLVLTSPESFQGHVNKVIKCKCFESPEYTHHFAVIQVADATTTIDMHGNAFNRVAVNTGDVDTIRSGKRKKMMAEKGSAKKNKTAS